MSSSSLESRSTPAPTPIFGGTPPGAPGFNTELAARLEAANKARYPRLKPRTRHLVSGGLPRYTNRLVLEKSPYLLQHAHNPVNWFPWGAEAFALAARLDRPVFLSVGYSTCHWCHVMEEESFEDPAIAELLNREFIAIKVDREERPDVDALYMSAVMAMRGRGGWPMTVVMTPEKAPFFAGTYFPARAGARGARMGLWEILSQLQTSYRDDHEAVVEHANEVTAALVRASERVRPGAVPGAEVLHKAVAEDLASFDAQFGGMGYSTKFPTPSTYLFLLRYARRSGDRNVLSMVTKTLDTMIDGGIYDHVGGGFHRYATERTWLVPHFEKMLYDNAQMVTLLIEAYQATGEARYAAVARDTLDYVAREMRDPQGGFYSATDADSDGEEGLFFVWKPGEIDAALSEAESRVFKARFGVTKRGNFEGGTTILSVTESIEDLAKAEGISVDQVHRLLASARAKLTAARERRVHPGLDDKVLAAWNGLMISAFAKAALVLNDATYLRIACAAADNLVNVLWQQGRLRRSSLDGVASEQLAFLDDYAFVIAATLDLHEASGKLSWLDFALKLQRVLDDTFADRDAGGYYFESTEHESLLTRQKPSHDGAQPTGNSVEAENLLRLWKITTDVHFRTRAEGIFTAFSSTLTTRPSALSRMLAALDFSLDDALEIVLLSPAGREDNQPFLDELAKVFLPNRVLIASYGAETVERVAALSPLIADKIAQGGEATAYVCRAGVCKRPATDVATFRAQIAEVTPYAGAADSTPVTRP